MRERGVTHSELDGSDRELCQFLQMRVIAAQTGNPPRDDQRSFPAEERPNRMRVLASPDARDGSIVVGQDASL